MHCPACGKEVGADHKFCTFCGAQLNTQSGGEIQPAPAAPVEQTVPAAPAAPATPATPPVPAAPQLSAEQDRVINSGSWGATLGIFYAAGMGAWGWFAGLFFASLIYPLYMVLWIIFIVKGKSIAWKSRKWQNFEEFVAVQRAWDLWGKILLVLQLLMIPAIMAAMVLVAVNGARAKARDALVKSDLRSLKTAAVMYSVDHENIYPDSLKTLVPTYIKELPNNPATGQAYGYKKVGASCVLSSPLENTIDMDLTTDADPTNGAVYDLACDNLQ